MNSSTKQGTGAPVQQNKANLYRLSNPHARSQMLRDSRDDEFRKQVAIKGTKKHGVK